MIPNAFGQPHECEICRKPDFATYATIKNLASQLYQMVADNSVEDDEAAYALYNQIRLLAYDQYLASRHHHEGEVDGVE
jgi:hypothetical protein